MYPQDHISNWISGQGLWNHISKKDWDSWDWQMNNRIQTPEALKALMDILQMKKRGFIFQIKNFFLPLLHTSLIL